MANFDIQGESECLSEKQNEFVCDILEKRGFKGNKVFIETFGKAGDNYCANVKRISVENNDGTVFKMIAKVAPRFEFLRYSMSSDIAFANEMIMYQDIFPKYQQLEEEAEIPEADRFKFPICYGTYNEQPHEIILLEDLNERNFLMLDRLKPLTNEEISLVLKSFAKIHTLAFVFKKKEPLKYKELAAKLYDVFTKPTMKEFMDTAFPIVVNNICSILDNDGYKKVIQDVFKDFLDEVRKINEIDKGSEYSVIAHGDAWTNNILFKLKDDKVQECILIDFQQSNEKSPVADFHYLINNCTDLVTRTENYNKWLQFYHDELNERLSYFGYEAKYVYPKEKVYEDLKRYARFSIGCCVLLTNVLTLDTKEAARLKDNMEAMNSVEDIQNVLKPEDLQSGTVGTIKAKVEGVLDTFYQLGYLP